METKKLTCCDIMIGDWVEYNGKCIQVENVHKDMINYTPDIPYVQEENFIEGKDISPIPLTAEILEKNFEQDEYDGYSYYEINDEFCIRNAYGCIFLAQWTDSESSLSQYPKFIIDIESVEQLQHIIRMLDRDKEIVL